MGAINLLARGYRVEVSADGATNWLRFNGLNDLNAPITPNNVDATDYESDGWMASEITMQSWKVTLKANAKATSGVLDPAMALVMACVGQFGDAARVYVRWYRKDGVTGFPSYSGRAIVEVIPAKTAVPDLFEQTVTLTGDGAPSVITNPYAPASVPSILSASPTGVTAGGQVTIVGSGFTGTVPTSGVKFGASNATSWVVLGDSTIVAVMPAGSAGAANIVVTNATGASTAFSYTRG